MSAVEEVPKVEIDEAKAPESSESTEVTKAEETPKTEEKKEETRLKRKAEETDEKVPGPHDSKRRRVEVLNIEKDVGLLITCTNKVVLKEGTRDLFHMLRKNRPDRENEFFDIVFDKSIPMGCAFIRSVSPKTPTELVDGCFQLLLDGEAKSKHIGRLIPMDHMCAPTIEEFTKLAEKIIKPVFEAAVKDIKGDNKGDVKSWALHFKTRGLKTVTKDMILKVIDQWSDGLPVSLENPSIAINIEFNKIFCGMALLKNWSKFKKYNVETVQNPEKAKEEADRQRDQNAKNAKKESEKKAEKAAAEKPAEKDAPKQVKFDEE